MRHERPLAILRLARLLAGSSEGHTLDEVAHDMRVDRRTAERMRDTVRALFPQMEEVAEGRTKRFRIPGGLDGFVQAPTADESTELNVAIRSLDQAGARDRAALLRSFTEKVRCATRAATRRRVDPDVQALLGAEADVMQAGPRPLGSVDTLSRIREALKSLRTCSFDYAAPPSGVARERVVTPYGVLFGRSYYLVGPEHGKTQPVLWRFDRISNINLGQSWGGAPETFDLAAFAARSFGAFQEEPEDVVLRFNPSAAADAKRFLFHPNQRMEDQVDGSLLVHFRAGGFLEMAQHLFSWSDAVDIVAPPRLQQIMRDELQRALAHHRGSG